MESTPIPSFDAYVFDLDGTLLNTLPDLVRLTNMVLDERGWPQRTRDEILSYVGDGGRVLLQRAAPPATPAADLDDAFARWQALYPTYGHALTRPYDGIPELLAQLKAQGAKLGVLSNKFDAAVRDVIAQHFPDTFDAVRGEGPDTPRKPDPTGLIRMLDEFGVRPERTAYLGDSGSDMTTALAAGAFPIGVAWGYRPVAELEAAGALQIVRAPLDLVAEAKS